MTSERLSGLPEWEPSSGLTPEEDRTATEILAKWDGGFLSPNLYRELARMMPQAIVEVVVFRDNNGTVETLLLPRPENEPVEEWRGKYHTPGTAMRVADFKRLDGNPLNGAFERIQSRELENRFAYRPQQAGDFQRDTKRGPEFGLAYYTELENPHIKPNHIWFPVERLAENEDFIQHQLGHVLQAAEVYISASVDT